MHPSVRYTDQRPATLGPRVIVSPTHPSPCCMTHMAALGPEHKDVTWPPDIYGRAVRYAWQYRRCIRCGYTVRKVLAIPDDTLAADVRATMATLFTRKPYQYLGEEA